MKTSVLTGIGDFDAGDGFSIVVGQEFNLIHDLEAQLDWFSNNDSVLSFEVAYDSVKAKATVVGKCELRGYDGDTLLKRLHIEVVSPKNEAVNVKVKTKVEPLP